MWGDLLHGMMWRHRATALVCEEVHQHCDRHLTEPQPCDVNQSTQTRDTVTYPRGKMRHGSAHVRECPNAIERRMHHF